MSKQAENNQKVQKIELTYKQHSALYAGMVELQFTRAKRFDALKARERAGDENITFLEVELLDGHIKQLKTLLEMINIKG